jgi:hypothetical protein
VIWWQNTPTWLDNALEESPLKNCISGLVRLTSLSICSIISDSWSNEQQSAILIVQAAEKIWTIKSSWTLEQQTLGGFSTVKR